MQYEKTRKDPKKWEAYKQLCYKSHKKHYKKKLAYMKKYHRKNRERINQGRKMRYEIAKEQNIFLLETV
jgi:hypothetical protein